MGKTAFIFPGQGSQDLGMGRDFYDAHEWAKDIFALADQVTGKPITRLCFEGPEEKLTLTANLQPAMTTVNLVSFTALVEKGIVPATAAGHSLGEYSALAAAGVISIEDTIKLVNQRGELMNREAEKNSGAMQAIIGLDAGALEEIISQAAQKGIVGVANYNTPQQTAITGEAEAVAEAGRLAQEAGARAVPLAVSGAWHSPLMDQAATDFAALLDEVSFSAPTCELFFNLTAQQESDPEKIKEIMKKQISSSVRWFEIIEAMLNFGVDRFMEVGPKRVLAGMNRKIIPKDAGAATINIQNISSLEKV